MVTAGAQQPDPIDGATGGWLCFWSIQGACRRELFPEVVLRPYEPGPENGARSALSFQPGVTDGKDRSSWVYNRG